MGKVFMIILLVATVFTLPAFAQQGAAGKRTVMKCSMQHDVGEFESHIRVHRKPGDVYVCKCFYKHGQ